MTPMMLLFFCFMGINAAAIDDKSDAAQKRSLNTDNYNINQNGNSNDNGNGWQSFKTYFPPGAQSVLRYDSNSYPKYDFEYAVSDRRTGDHKHHFESRDGNRVRGEYGLVEADGSLRKVQYNADDFNGFNAVVSKTVNRHGDSAISVSGQTRQFAPSFNQEVRINQFFPSKDSQFPVTTRLTNIAPHPAQDGTVDSTIVQPEDNSNIIPEGREQFVVPEFLPSETTNPENLPTPNYDSTITKMDTVEGHSYNVSPSALPVIAETLTNSDVDVPIVPNNDHSGGYPQQEIPHPHGEELAHKDDSRNPDSDVASSYYHSKVYYVGY